jgi:polar amino acid transport system ATP-binding protein
MNNQTTPAAEFVDVTKSYGTLEVLQNLSFSIAPAERVSLIGPSGSGKTTILRMLMTLEQPTSGDIRVFGKPLSSGTGPRLREQDVRAARAHIGMVFQQFNLFPHMSAIGNVMEAPMQGRFLPRAAFGRPAAARGHRPRAGDEAADHAPR